MRVLFDFAAHPLLAVMAIAVLSSLLAEIRIAALGVPVVALEMLFGMVLGPHGPQLLRGGSLEWLRYSAGLAALLFMTGLPFRELSKTPEVARTRPTLFRVGPRLVGVGPFLFRPGCAEPVSRSIRGKHNSLFTSKAFRSAPRNARKIRSRSVSCPKCSSENQHKFSVEMNIHFPGWEGLEKDGFLTVLSGSMT